MRIAYKSSPQIVDWLLVSSTPFHLFVADSLRKVYSYLRYCQIDGGILVFQYEDLEFSLHFHAHLLFTEYFVT